MQSCALLRMHLGDIYNVLGEYHLKVTQMPECKDKKVFLNNLKVLLRMFIDDIDTNSNIVEPVQI